MSNHWLAIEMIAKDRIEQALREAEQERFIRQVEASTGYQRVNVTDVLLVIVGVVVLVVAG